jgi:ADP-ribose pyrophosphatase YjhB (NUDIX family)
MMAVMKRRITTRAIVLHEGKLLAVRQKSVDGSAVVENSYWNLPGGGLDPNESLTDGLRREMMEETGIAATVGSLMYIQQFADEDTEYLEFFFHVTNGADYLTIDLSRTTHGDDEIAEIAFIDPSINRVKPNFLMTDDLPAQTDSPTTIISFL